MDIEKTITSLKKNGYLVRCFETSGEAVRYLEETVSGKTVGFGDSATIAGIGLPDVLAKQNTIWNPDRPDPGETFDSTAKKALTAEYFMLSANGISEDGVIVNLDGDGNRVAGSLYGHEKIYYIVGTNKLAGSLEETIWRVRNIAAPKNAFRLHYKTPCAVKGDKCYNCSSPDRICQAMVIHLKKIKSAAVEVVLIHENLGF